MDNLKEINGNSDFKICNIKSLNSLETIGEKAKLITSRIKDLSNLKIINDDA